MTSTTWHRHIIGMLWCAGLCLQLGCAGPIEEPEGVSGLYVRGDASVETNLFARFNQCQDLHDAKDWEGSSKCFVAFARDFPESDNLDKALFQAAEAFDALNESGKAIQVRHMLLEDHGDSELAAPTVLETARAYEQLAVFSRAAKFYELFAKNFPEHEHAPEALERAARLREGLGEYARAIAVNETFVELFQASHPDDARLATERVAALEEKMTWAAPTVVPGEAASDTVAAHATPAPDISEDELAQIIAENKHDPEAHHALACIYREKGAYNDAIKHARKSLAGDSSHPRGFEVLAMVYRDMGHSNVANLVLERGEEVAGEQAALTNVRGILAFDRGDLEGAKAHFARALELDETFEPARRNIDALSNQ